MPYILIMSYIYIIRARVLFFQNKGTIANVLFYTTV